MSLNDLLDVFDELDPLQRGFVTSKEIHQFYSSLVDSPVSEEIVDRVVASICGHGVVEVTQLVFIDILEELERRRAVETEAYWDFQGLDSNGNNLISLSHALLLFREYHGDLFSLDNWKKFLGSREKPDGEVYFDEIREWLSEPPGDCRPSTQSEIVQEESRLERVQADAGYRELKEADSLMDIKDLQREEEEERQEHIERSVKRKLHKWHTHGLAAMLEDHDGLGPDGDMRDESLTTAGKDSIKTSDVLALLEAKYSTLHDRVLMELASRVASMDSEKLEIFNKIKRMTSKPQKHRMQDEDLNQLLENTSLPFTLLSIVGDLADAEAGRRQEFEAMRAELSEQGKSEVEADSHLRNAFSHIVQGEQTCDVVLAQLNLRLKTEREAILSGLHSNKSQAGGLSSTQILTLHYCRLLRQMNLLQGEDHVTSAGLAVGLAERSQVYKPQRYDWDRDRSEQLAKERLEARVGRRQVKRSTANIDLDSLEKAGSVMLKTRLVEELEQAQYLEREAMVQFLQGSEVKSFLGSAASLSPEARQKKIRNLRYRRQECITNSNWTANQAMLAEATALYMEERRAGIEQTSPNVGNATMAAIVLADLQQRQEVEAGRILQESLKQNKRELTRVVLSQIEARQDQLFSNIAFVTLGGFEVSSEDQDFLLTLEAKFKAMRDQVFVFGLIERLGSGWKSMPKEEKQKEISQQRKEEKRLRGEGQLEEMAQLIGPRSQALPSLHKLLGGDKTFPNVPAQRHLSEVNKSVNLLADLASRFDVEQEALVSWLQLPEVKSLPSKAKHVQMTRLAAEKYLTVAEASHETALLAVGLLERLEESRTKDDQEKQLTLAERRFTLRKKAALNGEKLRSPPDEKLTPTEENVRDLQAILARAMLRRHYQEREVILSVLQDPGLDELVEAAAVMPPEQALRRLKELKTKRDGLDLEDKADNEEQTYIFEEAGAIRAAGKVSTLSRDLGRTVLLEEACTHLLAELQDIQDIELTQLFSQLRDMLAPDITARTDEEVKWKKHNYCNNVMKVLTKSEDGDSHQDFDTLVEQKYRRLLNLLVEESLCQQQGGKHAWNKLGHKQRVKAISALSAQATEIWENENQTSWICPKFQIQPKLSFLAGADKKVYQEAVASTVPGDVIVEEGSLRTEDIGGPETVADLHRRFKVESQYIRNYLEGLLDTVPSDDDKQTLRNKLTWETTLLTSVQEFASAALIVGLAERQTVDMNGRLEHDTSRYQMLAENLSTGKHNPPVTETATANQIEDISELQTLLLRALHHKHVDEWQVMSELLSSDSFRSLQDILSVETGLQRDNRITQLHRQRDALDLKEKSKHHKILEEALAVRKESVRQTLALAASGKDQEISENDIHARLISQVLQFQLAEAQVHLEAFVVEDANDLRDNHATILTEISQGHVTNIALVAFTGLSSESLLPADNKGGNHGDVEITQAVDGKYDALRDQLLIQALIDQMGEAEWNRLSDLERQRLLMELKLKERRLRREGKYDEAAALLGELRSNDENIRKLIGDARADHERRLRERLERRKARLAQGVSEEDCDDMEAEEKAAEEEEEREKKKNILLYLDQCSEQEKADLLKRLGDLGDDHERARQRHLELVRQRREERRLRQEGTLDAATLLMGMAQDQHDKSNLSKEEEKRRQQELARQRLELARQRRLQGDNLVRGETILTLDGEDENVSSPAEGRTDDLVLGLLDVRHARERNVLIRLLDEHSDGDARDEARVMTDDEIRDKLEEQQELFNLWRDSESRTTSDGEKILAESTGLSVEWKRRELEKEGELASDEDVKVALLAELQEEQEAEAGQAMLMLIDVDDERAEEIVQTQQKRLTNPGYVNVASVLLDSQGNEGGETAEMEDGKKDLEEREKTVVKALEKKYDAMKDKLLMEALMREMGEADWSRLSDLERQRKLVELKMRERRLRREGRMDELAQLLGNFAEDSDRLSQFLGESAEDQRRRVQEKLALRKRLREEKEAKGEAVDEEALDELVEEEDKKIQATNILTNLDNQFEAEKAALLSALRNQPDHLAREKKRQLELARFQRDARRLKKEDKLDSAAMIVALGEQNLKAQQQSVMSERDRQKELARQRLEALKQKRAAKEKGKKGEEVQSREEAEGESPSIEITDESAALQSSVVSGVEKLQTDERSTLMDLISKTDTSSKASHPNNDLLQELTKLQQEHQAWEAKTTQVMATQTKLAKLPTYDKSKFHKNAEKRREEQAAILQKALTIKLELESRRLETLRPDLTPSQVKEELSVCALTSLQEKQQKLAASTQEHIKEASVEELKQLRQHQQLASQSGVYPALSATCFHVCLASDLADMMQKKDGTLSGDESRDMEILLADEYNTEREELLQRGERESINVDAALKWLGEQYEQRKQALKTDMARQRAELKQRVASRCEAADDLAWSSAATAGQILATGSANLDSAKQAKKAELRRQDTLLQQRLQERREAKQAEKARKTAEAEAEKAEAADRLATPEVIVDRRHSMPGMTREKTVVDVNVTEDQKQAMYDQLLQQERFKHDQITAAQARQEMMLRKQREDRSNRRENEVAALFSLGERQKTTLQEFKRGERERQLAQMQDRMTRMRESRSQSPKKRGSKPTLHK